ncbi:MAG: RNA polymerase sigma factor [Elusimicrobia bacterium]|nr:RNA polymerase sigma factor [Elusimicrobiota bacterium]
MLQSFIEEYSDRAYQFAYRLCGDAEEAKELVQEAFFRLIKAWDLYDAEQPLEGWFLTILRNVYIDSVKRYDRRNRLSLDMTVKHDDGEGLPLAEVLPDEGEERILEALERREAGGEVREALASLSPEHRAALSLCDMEGMKYGEIAEVLGCPVGTVRSRVARARVIFREKMLEKTAGMVGYGV